MGPARRETVHLGRMHVCAEPMCSLFQRTTVIPKLTGAASTPWHPPVAALAYASHQASFIRAILQGGGGGFWVGGSSAGWVGLKVWTPTPLIIPRVSWVGLLPHLLSLVTGALSGCLLVPFSALSLCRWQVCRWQFFRWRNFFFDNILNLWTFCCTKLSSWFVPQLSRYFTAIPMLLGSNPGNVKFLVCHPLGLPNPGERLGFNLVHKKCSPQIYKRGGGLGGSKVGWVGPKLGGWVLSKTPPPLLQTMPASHNCEILRGWSWGQGCCCHQHLHPAGTSFSFIALPQCSSCLFLFLGSDHDSCQYLLFLFLG